jgi:hypothetical protein
MAGLLIAVVIQVVCVVILATHNSPTTTVTAKTQVRTASGFCSASSHRTQCTKEVASEKVSYLHYHYPAIWGFDPKGDQPAVSYKANVKGETQVCSLHVGLYLGRIITLGRAACGPPPVPIVVGNSS